jgi:flagellar biogenesis protein FliO
MGQTPTTEADVFVATHGWWPWLLTLFILILFVCVLAYFVKRRRAEA